MNDTPELSSNGAVTRSSRSESADGVIVDEFGTPFSSTNDDKGSRRQILDRIKAGERWMIVLTAIVTLATVGQFVLAYRNDKSTSEQVDKIITAANGVRTASESFSRSASAINVGVGNAVDKFNTQAEALKKSANQSSRLAGDTETANANAMQADRPWLGGYVTESGFSVGNKPVFTITFSNSGRRPALLERASTASAALGNLPDFDRVLSETPGGTKDLPSRAVLVPGQPFVSTRPTNMVFTQEGFDALNSKKLTFYVFGSATYRDARTGEVHHTHICYMYMPPDNSPNAQGEHFVNCPTYNDAD